MCWHSGRATAWSTDSSIVCICIVRGWSSQSLQPPTVWTPSFYKRLIWNAVSQATCHEPRGFFMIYLTGIEEYNNHNGRCFRNGRTNVKHRSDLWSDMICEHKCIVHCFNIVLDSWAQLQQLAKHADWRRRWISMWIPDLRSKEERLVASNASDLILLNPPASINTQLIKRRLIRDKTGTVWPSTPFWNN